jgi:hypothetical protein
MIHKPVDRGSGAVTNESDAIDKDVPGDVPGWALVYEAREYDPWSLTVDVIGLAMDRAGGDLQALLIVRGQEGPYKGMDAWPGGFVHWENDATADAAAIRELHEETGQRDPEFLEALGTYDRYGRDPRQFSGRPDPETGEWVRTGVRVVSKAYLALLRKGDRILRPEPGFDAAEAHWARVYDHLPWEDLRSPASLATLRHVTGALHEWAESVPGLQGREERHGRIHRLFSTETWDVEQASERWLLLHEAGLVEEAWRDRWGRLLTERSSRLFGLPLAFDHRTMLADALGVLRSRIKRQAEVAYALMDASEFKLSELQSLYEAVNGRRLYRSNFRRLVALSQASALVTAAGRKEAPSGPGKPADLYRFDPKAMHMPLSPGLHLPWEPLEP